MTLLGVDAIWAAFTTRALVVLGLAPLARRTQRGQSARLSLAANHHPAARKNHPD